MPTLSNNVIQCGVYQITGFIYGLNELAQVFLLVDSVREASKRKKKLEECKTETKIQNTPEGSQAT